MAHIRQSRPDSGLGFQAKILEAIQGVAASLGSGTLRMASPLQSRLSSIASSHTLPFAYFESVGLKVLINHFILEITFVKQLDLVQILTFSGFYKGIGSFTTPDPRPHSEQRAATEFRECTTRG